MNRRTFLRASAGTGLAGLSLLGTGCADEPAEPDAQATDDPSAAGGGRRLDRIGVQLYTVRSLMQQDFAGTLQRVADIGYDQVEFAGYYDHSPEEVREVLQRVGLEAPAAHIGYAMVRDELDQVIATARVVGHRYIIVPSLPEEMRSSLDAYREAAGVLNRAGERLRQEDLYAGYHNHQFEFEEVEGQLPYDVLLEETDPDLVKMEIDLAWITAAGQDPLVYFERYPGRFVLSHVKDRTDAGQLASVGAGNIDFRRIFAQAEQAGMEYFFVEHDRPDDPLQSITQSYRYLAQLTY